jgi:hypothetical protein
MATRALLAIRINELLALQSKLTRVMFSSVSAGKRNLMFFFLPKKPEMSASWEVRCPRNCAHLVSGDFQKKKSADRPVTAPFDLRAD